MYAHTHIHMRSYWVCVCVCLYMTFVQNIANIAQSPNHIDFREEATSVCNSWE